MRSLFELYQREQVRPYCVELDGLTEPDAALDRLTDREACGKVLMRFQAEHEVRRREPLEASLAEPLVELA
jgi:hypothetical protein